MVPKSWRRDWVTEKCEIARALARGEVRGSYGEAAILICAILSALAAEVWPGTGFDRKRFVELLVRHGSSTNFMTTISVPLLVQHLETTGSGDAAKLLSNTFLNFSPTRVIDGSDVDKIETELIAICPSLTPEVMRKFSYACLLYEDVRSSYAHEYKPGDKANSWPMTTSENQLVSYVNQLSDPSTLKTIRQIHFHIEWLATLAVDIARSIDALNDTLPHKAPNKWWICGAA